jgi:penicillin-binding protein 2
MGIDAIAKYSGNCWTTANFTGIDMDGEVKGILPSKSGKETLKEEDPIKGKWIDETRLSELAKDITATLSLQLAQATAIVANHGKVMKPHIVKVIETSITHEKTLTVPSESRTVEFESENIKTITDGMINLNKVGTGSVPFAGVSYQLAGKTGTAQVFSLAGKNFPMPVKFQSLNVIVRFTSASLLPTIPNMRMAIVGRRCRFWSNCWAPIVRQAFDYLMLNKWPVRSSRVEKRALIKRLPDLFGRV